MGKVVREANLKTFISGREEESLFRLLSLVTCCMTRSPASRSPARHDCSLNELTAGDFEWMMLSLSLSLLLDPTGIRQAKRNKCRNMTTVQYTKRPTGMIGQIVL
jgi:hypothetical protein